MPKKSAKEKLEEENRRKKAEVDKKRYADKKPGKSEEKEKSHSKADGAEVGSEQLPKETSIPARGKLVKVGEEAIESLDRPARRQVQTAVKKAVTKVEKKSAQTKSQTAKGKARDFSGRFTFKSCDPSIEKHGASVNEGSIPAKGRAAPPLGPKGMGKEHKEAGWVPGFTAYANVPLDSPVKEDAGGEAMEVDETAPRERPKSFRDMTPDERVAYAVAHFDDDAELPPAASSSGSSYIDDDEEELDELEPFFYRLTHREPMSQGWAIYPQRTQSMAEPDQSLYRAMSHVFYWTENEHASLRKAAAGFLLDADRRGEGWTSAYTQLWKVHEDGTPITITVTPKEYAKAMMSDGHIPSENEVQILNRGLGINTVLLQKDSQGRNIPTRYPYRSADQLNIAVDAPDEQRLLDIHSPTVVLEVGQKGGMAVVESFIHANVKVVQSFKQAQVDKKLRVDARVIKSNGEVQRELLEDPPGETVLIVRDTAGGEAIDPTLRDITDHRPFPASHEASFIVKTENMLPDGNCFYRGIAHIVYGDANQWLLVRKELADFLRQAAREGADWLYVVEDKPGERRQPIGDNFRVITPRPYVNMPVGDDHGRVTYFQYADDIEFKPGFEGHWGQSEELFLASRRYGLNFVYAQKVRHLGSGIAGLNIEKFPVREGGQLFDYPMTQGELAQHIHDVGHENFVGFDRSLNPNYRVGMLMWAGEHTQVIQHLCIGDVNLPASQVLTDRRKAQNQLIAEAQLENQPTRRSKRISGTNKDAVDAAVEFSDMATAIEQAKAMAGRQKTHVPTDKAVLPGLSGDVTHKCPTKKDHQGKGCAWKDVNHRIEYYDSGKFKHKCKYGCGALLLSKEWSSKNVSKCCANGKVDTEELRRDYERLQNPPPPFKDLCNPVGPRANDAKRFLKLIKPLNSFFSFASVMAHYKTVPGRGVKPVVMDGDLSFGLSGLRPHRHQRPDRETGNTDAGNEAADESMAEEMQPSNDNSEGSLADGQSVEEDNGSQAEEVEVAPPVDERASDPFKFAQYWVLTPGEAVEERKASNYRTEYLSDIPDGLLQEIESSLRDNHAMSTMYKRADEMLADWIAEHGEDVEPEFHMMLLDNRQARQAGLNTGEEHPHQTEYIPSPDQNEQVAVVWINAKGEAPELPTASGVIVTDRQGEYRKLRHTNPNKFAACFPLLDPWGDQSWRYGLKLNGVEVPVEANVGEMERNAAAIHDDDDPEDNAIELDEQQLDVQRAKQQDAEEEGEEASHPRYYVSPRQYERYMMQWREDPADPNNFHWKYSKRDLAQVHDITQSICIEQREVEIAKKQQEKKRIAPSAALLESLRQRLKPGETLGKIFFAPPTVKGSRKHMVKAYGDSMAMVREMGPPHLFLTFTGNNKWPELKNVVRPGERWIDQPMAVSRIFHDKKEELMRDILDKEIFGPVKYLIYSVEYQKRGMPHLHIIIALDESKVAVNDPATVDQLISARIPTVPEGWEKTLEGQQQKRLHDIITSLNMHDCDERCLVGRVGNKRCKKYFPKEYAKHTILNKDNRTVYNRVPPDEGGATYIKQQRGQAGPRMTLTDRHVVPYNAFISLKYNTHANLEWIGPQKCLDYIFKYVLKGSDLAYVRLKERGKNTGVVDYDEWQGAKTLYRTAQEAVDRLYSHKIVYKSHTVHSLYVHGPRSGVVVFDEGFEGEAVAQAVYNQERRSTLTAYFELCHTENPEDIPESERETAACRLRYHELPKYYWFDSKPRAKVWRRRKQPERSVLRGDDTIVRIGSVSPRNTSVTAIRTLLLATPGVRSWEELRAHRNIDGSVKVNDGTGEPILYATFEEAARGRGLLDSNELWLHMLKEAAAERMGYRRFNFFFASTIVHGQPPSPIELFNDLIHQLAPIRTRQPETDEQKRHRALRQVEYYLRQMGKTCTDVGLPVAQGYNHDEMEAWVVNNIREELEQRGLEHVADDYDMPARGRDWQRIVEQSVQLLNPGQRAAFEAIRCALDAAEREEGEGAIFDEAIQRRFNVKGDGGAGKTFLYNAVIAYVKSRDGDAIATASTGIAGLLLEGGRTAHSMLYIPTDELRLHEPPHIDYQSELAKRIRAARAIIIDEVTMLHKDAFDYVDAVVKAVLPPNKRDIPFGGKVVLIGGDWKQLLPVVQGSANQRIDAVQACVKQSPLYHLFETLHLTENMRVRPDQVEWRNLVYAVGTGRNRVVKNGVQTELSEVPDDICVDSRQSLIDFCFPAASLANPLANREVFCHNAILAPTNDAQYQLNEDIQKKLPGDFTNPEHRNVARIYYSTDTPMGTGGTLRSLHHHVDDDNLVNLHMLTPANLPPHRLALKMGSIVIMTRNFCLAYGLANGTRLQITGLHDDFITARILTGPRADFEVEIPKVRFTYGTEPGFRGTPFTRIQLPFRLAFAMTINRAQGQTLNRVGLCLDKQQAFSHGHVYVALSRVRAKDGIRIYNTTSGSNRNHLYNPVYYEVLDVEDRPIRLVVPHQPSPPGPPPSGPDSNQQQDANDNEFGQNPTTPYMYGADEDMGADEEEDVAMDGNTGDQHRNDGCQSVASLQPCDFEMGGAFESDKGVRLLDPNVATDDSVADQEPSKIEVPAEPLLKFSEWVVKEEAAEAAAAKSIKRTKSVGHSFRSFGRKLLGIEKPVPPKPEAIKTGKQLNQLPTPGQTPIHEIKDRARRIRMERSAQEAAKPAPPQTTKPATSIEKRRNDGLHPASRLERSHQVNQEFVGTPMTSREESMRQSSKPAASQQVAESRPSSRVDVSHRLAQYPLEGETSELLSLKDLQLLDSLRHENERLENELEEDFAGLKIDFAEDFTVPLTSSLAIEEDKEMEQYDREMAEYEQMMAEYKKTTQVSEENTRRIITEEDVERARQMAIEAERVLNALIAEEKERAKALEKDKKLNTTRARRRDYA